MGQTKLFATGIDLSSSVREKIITLLNQHLTDTFDLFSHTKQAHWNVKGPQFIQLHELFDKLAEDLEDQVDMIAERATSFGGVVLGTVRLAAAASRLPEYSLNAITGRQHIDALTVGFAALATTTRAAINSCGQIGDAGTADLFTEISRALDKAMWFLQSHVQE